MITEDKDFGQLVFASHLDSAGIILIRFPGNAHQTLGATVVSVIEEQEEQIFNSFVVIQLGQVRIGTNQVRTIDEIENAHRGGKHFL